MIGRANQFFLTKKNQVEITWLLGMSKFRKLAKHLGLSEKELECIAHDVAFIEDNMDK